MVKNFSEFFRTAFPMGSQSMRFSWCAGDHPESISIESLGPWGGGADSPPAQAPCPMASMARGRQGHGAGCACRPILSAWRAIGGMVPWAWPQSNGDGCEVMPGGPCRQAQNLRRVLWGVEQFPDVFSLGNWRRRTLPIDCPRTSSIFFFNSGNKKYFFKKQRFTSLFHWSKSIDVRIHLLTSKSNVVG
jgi:hypothetical protein